MKQRFKQLNNSPIRKKLRREGALRRRIADAQMWAAEVRANPDDLFALKKLKIAKMDVANLKQKLGVRE